jgi:hypothetical protein
LAVAFPSPDIRRSLVTRHALTEKDTTLRRSWGPRLSMTNLRKSNRYSQRCLLFSSPYCIGDFAQRRGDSGLAEGLLER